MCMHLRAESQITWGEKWRTEKSNRQIHYYIWRLHHMEKISEDTLVLNDTINDLASIDDFF
jgi:hypothetical protein